MAVPPGTRIDIDQLLQPKVEAEVCFLLAEDLDGSLDTVDDVRQAVAGAMAAIEVVDSRIAGWDISFVDTVADNASSGRYVCSGELLPLTEVPPSEVSMALRVNGHLVSQGNGSDCLGDPLLALLWLARTVNAVGDPLRAGELILSGALGPMVAAHRGDAVLADVGGLGTVAVSFSGGD
jgi:2-keto-4-pentenoate hydratase